MVIKFIKKYYYKFLNRRRIKISLFNLFKRKRYYIIRRRTPGAGFYSNYMYVILHIAYALDHNLIPVVDMENYRTLYNELATIEGNNNAWEYYYEQPFGISLNKAYSSKNYILSDFNFHREYIPYLESKESFEIIKEKAKEIRDVIEKYVRYRPELKEEIEKLYDEKFKGYKVLGVHIRGTDKRHFNENHYISSNIDIYKKQIDKVLKQYKIDKIFICTDERNVLDYFIKCYKDLVIYNEVYRSEDESEEGIHFSNINLREKHKYNLGYEVIMDMELLARSNYLIYSHSNVTNVALLINNEKYIYSEFVPGV